EAKHWWFSARRSIFRHLVHSLVSDHASILDIGCGTGGNLAAVVRAGNATGVDASADAVEFAQTRYPHLRFEQRVVPDGIVDELARADLVMLTDVLEHVKDDFRYLSDLLAPMRPGTLLLLTVPAEEALWSPHDEAVLHYRRYDPPRLRTVWTGLPVHERLFSPFNSVIYPAIKLVRWATAKTGVAVGERETDFSIPPMPVNVALAQAFAAERFRLAAHVDQRARAFPFGVSLVAVLERREGVLTPRSKPASLPPDRFDPYAR
ncbi:MAG: class I SAM-dependent methyltransferase, partial [Myxococcota bacterium]